MAISAPLYQLLHQLKPLLPHGGALLEIGEANWYGDLEPPFSIPNICPICGYSPPSVTMGAIGHIWHEQAQQACDVHKAFAIAKACYAHLFAPSRVVSVDMNGTPQAWKCDLNKPLPPLGAFEVVMNHGTAEHVFNIAQVFASIHAACKVGGLMLHDAPFTGWLDHGFYCLQPTLFYDLAAANGYEVVKVALYHIAAKNTSLEIFSRDEMTEALKGGIPNNAMLFVVLRKTRPDAFVIPMQGYYDGKLSAAGNKAWEELR